MSYVGPHDVSVDVFRSVCVITCYTYIYIYTHAYSNKENCTPTPKKRLITVAHCDDPYHQTNILETRSVDPVGEHCIVIFKGK